jgi:hypothetical protein
MESVFKVKKSVKKSPKRKSPKRESPKRKSPKRKSPKRKSPKRKSLCKQRLSKQIAENIKEGTYSSRSQAIAVAYSQVQKKYPHCKRYLKKKST